MSNWIQKITELENEIQELKKVNAKFESRILRLEQNGHDSESKLHDQQSLLRRLNCWEFKKCGRETGGTSVSVLGVCPAAQSNKLKGINRGKKGGRACWALVGTLCGGKVQGVYVEKIGTCKNCDFYNYVCLQEGQDFRYALPSKK
jgi:hypothetical protein